MQDGLKKRQCMDQKDDTNKESRQGGGTDTTTYGMAYLSHQLATKIRNSHPIIRFLMKVDETLSK